MFELKAMNTISKTILVLTLIMTNCDKNNITSNPPPPIDTINIISGLTKYQSDSLIVRAILDTNYQNDTTVEQVSSDTYDQDCICEKRIRRLRLNNIRILPENICNLTELRLLKIESESLTVIPEDLGGLWYLSKLQITGAEKLDTLPENIFSSLSDLDTLILSNDNLLKLPESIGRLKSLKYLMLSNNQISVLPASIIKLSNLECLMISKNNFSSLPDSINELKRLTILEAANNSLTSLPEDFGRLILLERIDLSGNNLTTLPLSILNLEPDVLFLNKDSLANLPDTIKNWMLRYDSDGLDDQMQY